MSTSGESSDFKRVLAEEDVFKLAIRGHAAIEDAIDTAIAAGFGGTTPPELRRLPFRTRLALLAALTPLPNAILKPLDSLAQLRHDFAHGRLDDLPPERVQEISNQFHAAARGMPALADLVAAQSPREALRICLRLAWVFVRASATLATQQRESEQKAVKLREDLRGLLAEQEN